MKSIIRFILLFLVSAGFFGTPSNAQKTVDDLTFKQAEKYYQFWEKQLYPLQRELIYQQWDKNNIIRVEKLLVLQARMKKDMAAHPKYFKLYPKQLKNVTQFNSMDKKNYQNYKSFGMAGDNEDPPAGSKSYISFYKRYSYWRKLMNDESESALRTCAKFLLKAEKEKGDKRVDELKYALRYAKAMKILFPNSSKADMIVKRAEKSLKQNAPAEGMGGDFASYYAKQKKMINNDFRYLNNNAFSEATLAKLDEFNYPELLKRMKADMQKYPEYFKIYPKKLPGSGMGCITKKNVNQFSEFNIADKNAEPPTNQISKKILDFYKTYCFWRKATLEKESMVSNLRATILKADQAEQVFKFERAVFAQRYAKAVKQLLPDNEQISDLAKEADEVYKSAVTQIRHLFTGKFHENHLQQLMVFSKKPVWGHEKESDIIQTIVPAKPAYITGFFAAYNSLGIPTLVLLNSKHKYANLHDRWGKAILDYAKVSMFSQLGVKKEYKSKAYFTFNVFPDIDKINYESHVQFIPHLNFIKWLIYQPSEVLEFRAKWGKSKKMAEGIIRFDLSGDAKKILKEYYKKLEAKRLSMVKFPNMRGCTNAKSKILNFSDLSKYGKVLKISLSGAGNIMKPWPKDHEVDWNTAKGFAAVEQTDGKVIIMALDFRKRPGAGKWKWWSVGSFPDLFPLSYQGADINAVKKINGGYEILKKNVNKCGIWYEER